MYCTQLYLWQGRNEMMLLLSVFRFAFDAVSYSYSRMIPNKSTWTAIIYKPNNKSDRVMLKIPDVDLKICVFVPWDWVWTFGRGSRDQSV